MEITFYNCTSEYNRINKDLSEAITVSGSLTDDTSIVNPVIRVSLNSNIVTKNYCVIPVFGRYYFVKDIVASNKELIITLHCDVLASFKNDILNSKATITRSNKGNKNIVDSLVLTTAKIKKQVKKVGTGFTKDEKYIIQIGG